MARRLNAVGRAWSGPRRRVQFAALVVAVIAIHGCVTRTLAERMEGFASAAKMPPRIEVAYVRSLEPEAPPAVAPAPPPPPPPPRRAVRPRAPKPASAPAVTAEAKAASAAEAARLAAEMAASEAAVAEAIRAAAAAASPEPAAASASAPEATVAAAASAPAEAASGSDRSASSVPTERIADAAAPPPPASAASAGEPFDWPASTRVSFNLSGNYRGEVTGNAQVEWIRVGSRYQVNLDLLIGPEFAPIISRRMRSEGDLTADGLTPNRYDEDTQAVFRNRRQVSVLFEPDAIVLANGDRRERWRGTQDSASQFVQLTYLFTTRPELLRVGRSVEVPLALPRNVDRWIYDVIDEVVIDTPFGPLPTFHLKPRRVRKMTSELSAEIWFAPQLRYLPVRIRIEQDPSTFVDLVIARKPEMASR
jgi:hypothetical protein